MALVTNKLKENTILITKLYENLQRVIKTLVCKLSPLKHPRPPPPSETRSLLFQLPLIILLVVIPTLAVMSNLPVMLILAMMPSLAVMPCTIAGKNVTHSTGNPHTVGDHHPSG